MQCHTICHVKPVPPECNHYRNEAVHTNTRYNNAQKKEECNRPCTEKSPYVPMFLMIPFGEDIFDSSQSREKCVEKPPTDKTRCQLSKDELKFPEMRNGILFTRCQCVHRDGLQDTCPLSQCQNGPNCLVKPWPCCLPAKYLQSRHPRQYPPCQL
ncbi:uncharacterized protein LOC113465167 [Ceratina calcarata]|uniref:Uncharacterized protein LOC113465167 n=1 Tax=Ceratina calcarata TaxID=156304 RepID=A0AAJ7SCM8_9HYME|nr:uncharacterized protein LOC113465167 [Ceratina calcarata]